MSDILTILQGDALEQLQTLPDESVQCCVTSPPYWGLRDYGHAGQIGLENTPDEYVTEIVAVFQEVRRVLKNNGTLWLNLGDSYAGSGKARGGGGGGPSSAKQKSNRGAYFLGPRDYKQRLPIYYLYNAHGQRWGPFPNIDAAWKYFFGKEPSPEEISRHEECGFCVVPNTIKPKDLVGIPWMVAFALRLDGWYLRQDIIWAKPNPMPESVNDRCTKAHEYLFLLSKNQQYYYDAAAISERSSVAAPDGTQRDSQKLYENGSERKDHGRKANGAGYYRSGLQWPAENRNRRSVWTCGTQSYDDAHFATYPPELIKPCILAGSKHGDMILDPFGGSGTTGMVAIELGRKATLIELNPDYIKLIHQRCNVTPGLALA